MNHKERRVPRMPPCAAETRDVVGIPEVSIRSRRALQPGALVLPTQDVHARPYVGYETGWNAMSTQDKPARPLDQDRWTIGLNAMLT
jgi:hypothetical protein